MCMFYFCWYRKELNRVIGPLPGTRLYIVKLEFLLGVFSPDNILDLVPEVRAKIGIPLGCEVKELPLSNEWVKILIDEFTELSCEDYSEQMVNQIFTVLKEMELETDEGDDGDAGQEMEMDVEENEEEMEED